jgi:hypothetical protein
MIKDPTYVPPTRGPNQTGPLIVAEIKPISGQLKEGHVQGFTVMCDEGIRPGPTGGTDTAPSPLGYFTLGIGF